MKKTANIFAIFLLLTLSACSTFEGWFDEDEPLPSELGKRTPMMNSSLPPTFPNAIDAMMPPMADSGMGGGMGIAPEPPAFIGSNGAQPFSQPFPQQSPAVFATPMPAPTSAAGLPMISPVDVSAANNAAAGLPVQRRAPEFNQSLGIVAENKIPALKSGDGFPKLAQIPPTPIAPVSPEIDSRIVQMKADLQASQTAKIDMPPMQKVAPEIMPKNASNSQATTNFASLKPLPNEPIYKIADAPKVIAETPRVLNTQGVGSLQTANITKLSSLRPISGRHNAGRNGSRSAGGKARMGIARHSTYYGEY